MWCNAKWFVYLYPPMHIYACSCIFTYIYIYIYAHGCISMHIDANVCMCIYISTSVSIYLYLCLSIPIYIILCLLYLSRFIRIYSCLSIPASVTDPSDQPKPRISCLKLDEAGKKASETNTQRQYMDIYRHMCIYIST